MSGFEVAFWFLSFVLVFPSHHSSSESPPATKRQNEDDLICPITHGLPQDPVIAEDGRFYEKEAIEKHFKMKCGELISPITRKKMGNKLLPAPWLKNTIETLIENGAISGEPAEDWKRQVKLKKEVEGLLKKAEGGNVFAMENAAVNYNCGNNGFTMDLKQAYYWYEKARVAGSFLGIAKVGDLLALGLGVTKDKMKAMMFLSIAAERGSDLGAYILGLFLADGLHGFPVDKVEARRLLERSLSGYCPHKNMNADAKVKAQKKLDELVNQQQA